MPITRINKAAEAMLINARKICLFALLRCTATRRALVVLRGPEDSDICYNTFSFSEPEYFFILITLCHVTRVYNATCLMYNPARIVIVMVGNDDHAVCGLQQVTGHRLGMKRTIPKSQSGYILVVVDDNCLACY